MPSLFDTFRFTANNGSGVLVYPLISGLRRRWETIENSRAYRVKLTTKMLFKKLDYDYFRAIYDAGTCAEVSLLIENFCGGAWETWFEGLVPINNGKYNASRCEVSFDILPNDVYECANKGFDINANWLSYGDAVTVKAISGTVTTITCTDGATTWPAPDFVLHFYKGCWGTGHITSPAPDVALAWRPIQHDQYFVFLPGPAVWKLHTSTTWAREEITSVSAPIGGGWINISGTLWVRPVNVGFPSQNSTSFQYGITWETQALNANDISNGRKLSVLLDAAAVALDCGITEVVSDFFNINPDATAPANDAYTYAADYLQNVFFFQKSDIVRADASNDATRFTMNWKEFLHEMGIFNVSYAIYDVGGVKTLRLEHYTYFEGAAGLDLTTYGDPAGKFIVGLNEFEADRSIPRFESFAYQESYRPKFLYQRIDYPLDCVTTQGDERTANLLCADFGGLSENPDAGLEGFFLMATYDIGSGEYLMDALGGEANGAFAWENILPALWADGRFHLDATSTVGPAYVVNSIARFRKPPVFTIKFPCSQAFEPADLVTTQLGLGEIETAEQDTEKGTLTLTLLQ